MDHNQLPDSQHVAMKTRSTAFSLVEVLAAVTIIGIITFLAIPNIVRIKEDGEENLARARAETLNMAIASYVQSVGGTAAQDAWQSQTTPAGYYGLISPFIAFAEADLDAFMPTNYVTTNWPTSVSPPNSRVRAMKLHDGTVLP
jgi:type II secretory pathway pseudopilin PulG